MRESNVEINGLPEHRSENLSTTLISLAEAVGCSIGDADIQHVTRVAKLDKESTRPRAVIAKLRSARQRDTLLAAVTKFNKNKKAHEKLNSGHFGVSGSAPLAPIYVSEHLTPANKSLHAAARTTAKVSGYKYVWVRNGRIYMRKDESCSCILIRSHDTLKSIT
ncbi:uncharacterized protein LOC126965571 [Leptidea sinapis]|uniref:uncharacterized protein LOC126965571 n=1 Tax=Leptidea sinapis TaxID=189913 RepID=UPI0021C34BDE|nr:uncharacterized protein LOC126965571 [Leptidea sinapis]